MTASIKGLSRVSIDITYNANPTGATSPYRINAGPNGANDAVIPDIALVYGTGTVLDSDGMCPVNSIYFFQGSIAATTNKSIDLTGGSDVDVAGVALAFTHVKYALVYVLAPDGLISVQVGPRGVSNSWQGFWGGTGATVYDSVYWRAEYGPAVAGIAVTAGTGDLFNVYNPGAAGLTAGIVIAGKK